MAHIKQETRVSPVRRFLRHPLWAPLNRVEAWSRLATAVNPSWSLVEPRARVLRVVDEAPGVRSLWLRPNRRFGGFRPGQHVLVELEIDGARQGRCFSLSAAPRADGLVRLTVKRKENGAVSAALQALAPGQVLRLGQAQGDFAPRGSDGPLLMIAAGSGVTPMMSLLLGMADAGDRRPVTLLQSASDDSELIFADEIRALGQRLPNLRWLPHASREHGRLDGAAIHALAPDWRDAEALVCGPDGFMATVETMYAQAGLSARLQSESFGRRAAPVDPGAATHEVTAGAQRYSARSGQSLLEAAEAAGLSPRYGCRRGICRSCQCRKLSGTVLNQLTGQLSGPGEEWIQPCITTPQGALELAP